MTEENETTQTPEQAPPKAPANIYAKIDPLLRVTKLTITDLAFLSHITRPSIYNYMTGKTKPRSKQKQRLDHCLRSLHTAYKRNILPFSVKPVTAQARRAALLEIITETQNM